ncbi:E3 ubiquitin-protein ligase RNF34-like isoform X2 [Artemia franciscana]|uniref:E3 ubiquitin-protein ligase RNF34-like isoform X2 n=1 Tax=Artemia franciscana TaxID=6661 RepID=UPI0032DA3838
MSQFPRDDPGDIRDSFIIRMSSSSSSDESSSSSDEDEEELTQFNSNPGTSSNPSNPIQPGNSNPGTSSNPSNAIQPGNVRLWNEIRLPDEIAKGADNLPDEELCQICVNAPLNCVILECGHMVSCVECAQRLAKCPICRQFVDRVVCTYKA